MKRTPSEDGNKTHPYLFVCYRLNCRQSQMDLSAAAAQNQKHKEAQTMS